jgi:SRSO17 transposase
MIKRAKSNGLPFSVVCFDRLYGESKEFRHNLDKENIIYIGAVKSNQVVFLEKPEIKEPVKDSHQKGESILQTHGVKISSLMNRLKLMPVKVRDCQRGVLKYEAASIPVWTLDIDNYFRQELLLVYREFDGNYRCSLSNADKSTKLEDLCLWRSQRYFAERIFQDLKYEVGWGDLCARKYRSWVHHIAIDALSLWFIGQVKLDWLKESNCDPRLKKKLNTESLPILSVRNVREIFKAVLPRDKLTEEDVAQIIAKQMANRALSKCSYLKKQEKLRREGGI